VASDDSDAPAAPKSVSELGEHKSDGSESMAGNHLDCTGQSEFLKAFGVLSVTDLNSPETEGLLSVATAAGKVLLLELEMA